MKRLLFVQALLLGAVSAVPLLYVRARWPHVPALVAIHYGAHGVADRWAPREVLWGVASWPVMAFIVFTWFPQVRGATWFWRSARQRQVRALAVASLTVFALSFAYAGIHCGKGADSVRYASPQRDGEASLNRSAKG